MMKPITLLLGILVGWLLTPLLLEAWARLAGSPMYADEPYYCAGGMDDLLVSERLMRKNGE